MTDEKKEEVYYVVVKDTNKRLMNDANEPFMAKTFEVAKHTAEKETNSDYNYNQRIYVPMSVKEYYKIYSAGEECEQND